MMSTAQVTGSSLEVLNNTHRRTSQGAGGAAPAPPDTAKSLFSGQKLIFWGRIQQPKMKKICIY